MFECLACNLLQISPLKLCFEKCVLRMQEMLFQRPRFLGDTPSINPQLSRTCGTLLTPSTIAYYAGVGQGKWALWQFCPTTEDP
jgi:hypothetical protein